MGFDVERAKAAGYNDDEILTHLRSAGDSPFDVDGALKAGYSKPEIISFLAPKPTVPQPEPQPPRTAMQNVGVGTRNVVQGAMALPALVYDAAALPFQAGIGVSRLMGSERPYLPSGASLVTKGLTALGLPVRRAEEETQGSIMEGATGVIGPGMLAKGAQYAERVGRPALAKALEMFGAQPVTQAVGGATGAAGAEIAKEMDAGPVGELAAGVATGVLGQGGAAMTGRALGNSAQNIASRISGLTKSDRIISKTIADLADGDLNKGIQIVSERLAQSPDSALVDVLGMPGQLRGKAVANVPEGGADIAEKFILDRQAGRSGRMQSAADELSDNSFYPALKELNKLKLRSSGPLYKEAFAPRSDKSGKMFAPWDDRLQRLLDDPIVKQGMAKGIRVQQLEAVADDVPFNFQEYAVKGFDDAGQLIIGGTPNLRAMDAAKRGMDTIINEAKDDFGNVKWTEYLRAVDKVRKSLVNKLDDITTDETGRSAYKEARAAYAGPASLQDAAWMGRKFVLGDQEATAKNFAAMNEGEKIAFKLGVRRELSDYISKDTQAAPGKFASKKEDLMKRLESVFSPKEMEAFRKQADAEIGKVKTEAFVNPRGGSQTEPLRRAIGELQTAPDAAQEFLLAAARGSPGSAISSILSSAARKLSGPSKETAKGLAEILFELTPAKQKEILERIQKSPRIGNMQAGLKRSDAAALAALLQANLASTLQLGGDQTNQMTGQ
jgi:hypothetical protein